MRSTNYERECKVAERHASQACPSECEFRRVHQSMNREPPARRAAFQAVVMGSTPIRFTNQCRCSRIRQRQLPQKEKFVRSNRTSGTNYVAEGEVDSPRAVTPL